MDKVARERFSTVYMPGWKITMLPDEVVQAYTLIEGRDCPAVSIYFTMDEASFELKSRGTRLERVPIAQPASRQARRRDHRHDALGRNPADYAFAPELAFAWRLAKRT